MADDGSSWAHLDPHPDGHGCTDPYPHALGSCTGLASPAQAHLSVARDSLIQLRKVLQQVQRDFERDPTPANSNRLEMVHLEYDAGVRHSEQLRGRSEELPIE